MDGKRIKVTDLHFAYVRSKVAAVRGLDFTVERGEIFGFLGPSGAGKSTTQKILIGLLEAVGLNEDGDKPVGHYSRGMKCRLGIARSLLCSPELLFLDEPTSGLDPVNADRIKELIRGERDAGCTVFLTTHDMSAADELCDRVAFIVDGRIACIESPRALKLQYGERTVRVEYGSDDGTAQQDFPLDGLGDNTAFHQLLRTRDVQTIHTREAGLADIFIRITGRHLA